MNKAEIYLSDFTESTDFINKSFEVRQAFRRLIDERELESILTEFLQSRVNAKCFSLSELDKILEDVRNHKIGTFEARLRVLDSSTKHFNETFEDKVNAISDEDIDKGAIRVFPQVFYANRTFFDLGAKWFKKQLLKKKDDNLTCGCMSLGCNIRTCFCDCHN